MFWTRTKCKYFLNVQNKKQSFLKFLKRYKPKPNNMSGAKSFSKIYFLNKSFDKIKTIALPENVSELNFSLVYVVL